MESETDRGEVGDLVVGIFRVGREEQDNRGRGWREGRSEEVSLGREEPAIV